MRRLFDHSGDREFAMDTEMTRVYTQVVYGMIILFILWCIRFPIFF